MLHRSDFEEVNTVNFVNRHLFYVIFQKPCEWHTLFTFFQSSDMWSYFAAMQQNIFKLFKLKKRVINIMSGAEPRSSCRGQFGNLKSYLYHVNIHFL